MKKNVATDKNDSIVRKVSILLRGYKILQGLIPGYLTVATIRAVFSALLPFINIMATALILNAITEGQSLRDVVLIAIITAVINFFTRIVMHALGRRVNYLTVNLSAIRDKPLNEKQQEMDFTQIESHETRQLRQEITNYESATGRGIRRLFWVYEDMLMNFFTVVFSISIIITMFTGTSLAFSNFWEFLNTPWFAILFAVLIVGNALFNMLMISVSSKKVFAISNNINQDTSVMIYYEEKLFTKYNMGKDIKMYKLQSSINNAFKTMMSNFDRVASRWESISGKYDSFGEISANILGAIVYIAVVVKAVLGGLGIGSIVQYVGGVNRFTAGFTGLARNLADLSAASEAIDLYLKFMDLPNKLYHGTLPVEKRDDNEYDVEFHNVSFKYPDTDNYVLKDFSLKLSVGQRLAVVGMNGSGKTTMIKLLCRLYDPTEGEITLNGIDIKKYDYQEYMEIFGVVFQDYHLFSFPLGQNVAASVDCDNDKVIKCLTKVGFAERLTDMPKGIDTALYKNFDEDGVEISGGEAQKIAIARALYKDAPFIILDEPTAALDPIAEFEVYTKLDSIIENKTAIFISHRLSSCRFCHDIVVFHEGQLVQRGSHDELVVNENGMYFELWNAQAQYYS